MNKYYYNIDSGRVESLNSILADYDELLAMGNIDAQTPTEYVRNCMVRENGVLMTIPARVRELTETINRQEVCGIDDGLDSLRSELSELERLYLET